MQTRIMTISRNTNKHQNRNRNRNRMIKQYSGREDTAENTNASHD